MSEFDEYIVHGEPRQKEKADAWQTAIGLQDVDGLKVSAYLLDTAFRPIEGKISIGKTRERIRVILKYQYDTLDCLWKEFVQNDSPATILETDENCHYFLVRIYYHEEEKGISYVFLNDKIVNKIRQRNLSDIQIELLKNIKQLPNITFNGLALKLKITVSILRNQYKSLNQSFFFVVKERQ